MDRNELGFVWMNEIGNGMGHVSKFPTLRVQPIQLLGPPPQHRQYVEGDMSKDALP